MKSIRVIKGDITKLTVDAVVNSANRSLLGGGGVDRAIHRAAGRELLLECMTLNGCEPGSAKVTNAYGLPAKRIIHAVGHPWLGGGSGEKECLASTYKAALDIAEAEGLESVAFPCISRGIHRFPAGIAADIALDVIRTHSYQGKVIICCVTDEDYEVYWKRLFGASPSSSSDDLSRACSDSLEK